MISQGLVILLMLLLSSCSALNGTNLEVVLAPPTVTVVEIGDTVSLVCAAQAHNMSGEPYVHFMKDVGPGPDYPEDGSRLPGTGVGKLIFYLDAVKYEDIDSYKCVIDGGDGDVIEVPFELDGPELTCQLRNGDTHVAYGAVWQYKTWEEAHEDCHDRGMELALPTSAEENTQLVRDLKLAYKRDPNSNRFAHENWVWLAAHDISWEGVWTSSLDNTSITYTNWAPNQPDNKRGKGEVEGGSQDVASLNVNSGRWDDTFSSFKRPYVCKCLQEEDQEIDVEYEGEGVVVEDEAVVEDEVVVQEVED